MGSQSKRSFALVMSGHRCRGSSSGSGSATSFEDEPVSVMIFVARSRMVSSAGLPRFTGPLTSRGVSLIRSKPSTRSSMKQNARL